MAQNYRHILFDDAVKIEQERHGSRASYARMDAGADGTPDALTPRDALEVLYRLKALARE